MKDTIKKLPKWFNGDVYTEGGTVENPFSGEHYSLDSAELSMYDFIKGLDWFRAANPQAYMVLLD